MIKFIKRFWRKEDGVVTTEFVLVFPVIFYFFGFGAEVGIYQLRQVMFERGVDIVVRQLRLGNEDMQDADALVSAICEETFVLGDCNDDLHLEMEQVEVTTYRGPESGIDCIDRTASVKPVITMTPGSGNDVMILRFCLLIDPVFANWGLGAIMPQASGGGIPLYAQTFYVNEP